ncbi:MurR/RpiR family transcriptional regulator [Thermomonas aquatica]|jgi:DNA-binding MurR/RpiR family transcriptional regulator|uniref:MurR/RpiR family transcriptional regulator n=1 Tax=Thermomonas aquatica TaxID=2202149 RepID=A0A5B7ZNP9_9GAMM|nr:MurR/RpiR family transcriptional regulator [Thermomonas aquatica]QDA56319.1 MurR/RpiR family transcriptional regulator [Thermomonas aquatica]
MTALVKIRSERDRMSAIERRIADFILENAQLLRDYSSQQLANALGISQSSVVKFCQKLGFKGYPDLKLSINEAVVRADNGNGADASGEDAGESPRPAAGLWQRKSEAEETTRLINPPKSLDAAAAAIGRARTVFIIGLGEDDIHARAFALRLSLLGILTVHNFDPAHMTASLSAAAANDVLLVFSEHGMQPALCHLSHHFRARQRGKVVTVTRHSSNALRAHADVALLVSAHDERAHIEPLLYHSALQHLLDRVYIRLCEADGERRTRLQENLERIQPLLEP